MQPFGWYRALMRHPQYRWLAILGSLIYLVSPIDIAPDIIPLVGQIDDIILLTVLFSAVMQIFSPAIQSSSDPFDAEPSTRSSDDPTVQTVDVKATSVD